MLQRLSAFLLLLVNLLGVQSIVDPRSVIDSMETFANFTLLRQRHINVTKDYPYGCPKFNCPAPEFNDTFPKDAHHLRPSDFRVIAALGDSLSVGRDALSETAVDLGSEFVGISFDIGGDATLATRTTLPNILSQFSPSLAGASLGVRRPRSKAADTHDFNLAVSGSYSTDLEKQVDELISRLRSNASVDFDNDWKLITIFVGSNDLCKYTDDEERFAPDALVSRVNNTLRSIRGRIPRTFVNVLPPFNVFSLNDTHEEAPFCAQFHSIACPSLFKLTTEEGQRLFEAYYDGVKAIVHDLSSESFAVTFNPALILKSLPLLWGSPNLALLAIDCFHFSGLTHDAAAKIVWENLLRPEDDRVTAHNFAELKLDNVVCPDPKCPFFHTSLTTCALSENGMENEKPRGQAIVRVLAGTPMMGVDGELTIAGRPSSLSSILLIGIASGLTLLAVGSILAIIRYRKRAKPETTERTPLLLTLRYSTLMDDDQLF